jgi:PhnB protein
MNENRKPFFAPQLLINNGVKDISFYANAFGATENFCLRNEDDSVHVAELSIHGAIFGAVEISPAKDYEYNYRQGEIKDLFGHHWLIQKKI